MNEITRICARCHDIFFTSNANCMNCYKCNIRYLLEYRDAQTAPPRHPIDYFDTG